MFQYTREIIINDQAFGKRENTAKGILELFIPNVGSYNKNNIKGVIYSKAVAGIKAELVLPTSATPAAEGDVIRYTVKMRMQAGKVDPLLANYTTIFTRGIVVEVEKNANQARILEAFTEAMRGMEEWPVQLDITNKKILAKSEYLTLQLITEELKYRTNSISEMVVVKETVDTERKGTRPFGTYETLVKDYRLPTMENIRPWGEAQEEYPQKGHTYDLFELTYVADRNIGGFDVLGQKATSVTKHRFWVRDNKVDEFIAALEGVVEVDINGDGAPAPAPISA